MKTGSPVAETLLMQVDVLQEHHEHHIIFVSLVIYDLFGRRAEQERLEFGGAICAPRIHNQPDQPVKHLYNRDPGRQTCAPGQIELRDHSG
jgi:hypothetical protein